jgi:hypothetical protein
MAVSKTPRKKPVTAAVEEEKLTMKAKAALAKKAAPKKAEPRNAFPNPFLPPQRSLNPW